MRPLTADPITAVKRHSRQPPISRLQILRALAESPTIRPSVRVMARRALKVMRQQKRRAATDALRPEI
jgi:hypothetical protein